jgi:hypothetical protein
MQTRQFANLKRRTERETEALEFQAGESPQAPRAGS